MTTEAGNLAAVRHYYDAFARRETDEILDGVHPDIEWSGPDYEGLAFHGTHRGRDGVASFFRLFAGTIRVEAFVPDTFTASGDFVMTAGVWSGTAVATGKPFRSPWAMRFEFKDGKLWRFRGYQDTAMIKDAITPDP